MVFLPAQEVPWGRRGVGLLRGALQGTECLPFLPPSLQVKSSELQTIKTELTQIKSNIDALLGRLEQIAEEQKLSAGQWGAGMSRGWPWASQLPPGSDKEMSTPRFQGRITGQNHTPEFLKLWSWGLK